MIYSKIIVAILLALSLSLPTASAVIDDAAVQYYVSAHNSMINNAPQFVKSLAGNETIDLNIMRDNGSIYHAGLEMKNAQVCKIIEGGASNPDVSINATEYAVNKILGSNDPLTVFMQEMNSGDISIQMHHSPNKSKGCPFL
jgi:hypothetical protein